MRNIFATRVHEREMEHLEPGSIAAVEAKDVEALGAEFVLICCQDLRCEVLRRTNLARDEKGLNAFQNDQSLQRIAQEHADAMSSRQREFGHGGFQDRLSKMKGFCFGAENCHFERSCRPIELVAQTAVASWLNSPPHRVNMFCSAESIGVGVSRKDNTWFVSLMLGGRTEWRCLE
mmetsp:Transcript_36915/g.59729  ORF Transcript_36915/g.59729 Transcript_36915/m.59729 type:complete len:176 (-) Transcript_36915:143-670(-)